MPPKKVIMKSKNLEVSYYCTACNFCKGQTQNGYNHSKGSWGNLSIGDVAIHPNEECFQKGLTLYVNGKTYTVNDKCGKQGRIDIWRGYNQRYGTSNNCPECNKEKLSGKVVKVSWEQQI